MSAQEVPTRLEPEYLSGTPICLQSGDETLFALLHGTDARRTGIAALLCPPFGWEEVCCHRGLRSWAAALAQAGIPTLRIDLPSTGDSGGRPQDPGRLQAWTDAAGAAAGWLRRRTQATRVAVIGIGLGGLAAVGALGMGAEIDDLVLWGVPSRGRRLLREMRAHTQLTAPPDSAASGADGGIEAMGYLITPETAGELEDFRADQLGMELGPGNRVLLLRRDGVDVDPGLRDVLARAGASVEVADGSDWGWMMSHPQQSVPPWETIARSIKWLTLEEVQRPADRAMAFAGARAEERSILSVSAEGTELRERPVEFRWQDMRLPGILTEAAGASDHGLCAVLLNAGAVRRVGPNRTWVEAARRWAAAGVPALRVDLCGIGDADGEDPRLISDSELNAAERLGQTLAVLDGLAALGAGERFVLGGLCSGAYWSLKAAEVDERVIGTLLINLYAFEWTQELVHERDTAHAIDALQGRAWRRLLRGDLRRDHVLLGLRSLRPGRLRAASGYPVERAQRALVLAALDRLRERDVQTLLLLGEGEPLLDQFQRLGILDRLESWPNITLSRIPVRDHMFRALEMQRHVHRELDGAIIRTLEHLGEGAPADAVNELRVRSPGTR